MTDGMMTRAKAVDEQLSAIADQLARHDAVFTKIDSLCATVQQHSDSFDLLRKSHAESFDILRSSLAAQQSVMAEMMMKLQQLDKATTHPPLLPLPTPKQGTNLLQASPLSPLSLHSSSSMPSTRLPTIDVPLFTGENVLGWLFQMNHFFSFHQIPDDHRLPIAAFYMSGSALQWFQWLHTTDQLHHWDDFVRKLELRFGPSSFANHEAALFKLKQTSSLTAYLQEFESLSTRVVGLSQQSLLNCFLSGLREDVQRELYILKPASIHDAVGMSKLVEDKFQASRSAASRALFHRPPALAPNPSAQRPNSLPIKRLTPTEMAARREKGLCFNCDAKFTPGHRCNPAQFLCLLMEPEDLVSPTEEPPPELQAPSLDLVPEGYLDAETPSISLHALTGQVVPSTLKIAGTINGKDIIVLIDGGSTNNFVQTKLANHLGLTVQPSNHLRVTVGNGDAVTCGGACLAVPLKLGDETFVVDLLLLPIYGADVVLGVQWMRQLGPILFDYGELWMEFNHLGHQVRLKGLDRVQYDSTRPASLRQSQSDSAQLYQLTVEPV
ncbi:uncharacterized protein LOC120254848 [Dioscorea cayenensis subsp. rotundata]|uniref:Uncharacterized protein LOC120254848 n=1 Tax=Dioscorea cayennensis subsp. rotundata TaxID=55577 RepID=A0AB40AV43_DIOCR|nr:uncharacterized protein LOC120254848 [Dioscorea cayenensis subsp. rotundata]XP_039118796.1 uncharacterized protein LOC120254848 [Dioscorea cayenensis subsp. rotundata]